MKLFKFGGKGSKRKTPETIHERNNDEPVVTNEMTEQKINIKRRLFKDKQGWNVEEIGIMHNEI